MFQPKAEVIADSINQTGDRLTTFVLTYHRMIHSEFMTHRMLSKNSSSSRAIPVEKMIKLVESQEVYPLHWGKNQKGMSAQTEVTEDEIKQAFDQADTNNDGFIDIDEAKNANLDVKTTEKLNRLNQALESIENLNNNNSYDFQWKKDLMDRELSVIKQALVDTLNKKDDDTITYF
jgi:hypothetical protein